MLLSILVADGILSSFGSALLGSLATAAAGAIVGAVVLVVKKPFKVYQENKAEKEKAKIQAFKEEIVSAVSGKEDKENGKLQGQIDELKTAVTAITAGVLSIQGRDFKKHCRELLEKPTITENEYIEICKDYKAYTDLKGNGEGELLFKDLEAKHQAQIAAQAQVAAQKSIKNKG